MLDAQIEKCSPISFCKLTIRDRREGLHEIMKEKNPKKPGMCLPMRK